MHNALRYIPKRDCTPLSSIPEDLDILALEKFARERYRYRRVTLPKGKNYSRSVPLAIFSKCKGVARRLTCGMLTLIEARAGLCLDTDCLDERVNDIGNARY